jgi:hypothetical protein
VHVAYAVISDNTSRAPFSVVNNAKGKTVQAIAEAGHVQ